MAQTRAFNALWGLCDKVLKASTPEEEAKAKEELAEYMSYRRSWTRKPTLMDAAHILADASTILNESKSIKDILWSVINADTETDRIDAISDFVLAIEKCEERSTLTKAAEIMSNAVNDITMNPDDFAEAMMKEHRTLQQSVMKAFIAWLAKLSELPESQYDDRNVDAVTFAKKVVQYLKDTNDERTLYMRFI
jgi:hypothetical protein